MKKINRRDFLCTSLTATAAMAAPVVNAKTISASSGTETTGYTSMKLSVLSYSFRGLLA